jgi:hypothetical protein
MKNLNVLINKDFRAVAKGNNITAIDHQDEFLFTSESEFPTATLKEIAEANGFTIPSKLRSKAQQNEFVFGALNELNIAESTMSKLEKVLEIVNAGVEAGKTDDEMRIDIIQSGVTFKEAGKLFAQAMEQSGHRISPKARDEKIAIVLEGEEFNPSTTEELDAMVVKIVSEVSDTSEKQAIASIRKWAKENEIELPKATKKAAGRASGGSMVAKTLEWLLDHKDATEAEVMEFVSGAKEGMKEEQAKKYVSVAIQALEFARKFQG